MILIARQLLQTSSQNIDWPTTHGQILGLEALLLEGVEFVESQVCVDLIIPSLESEKVT